MTRRPPGRHRRPTARRRSIAALLAAASTLGALAAITIAGSAAHAAPAPVLNVTPGTTLHAGQSLTTSTKQYVLSMTAAGSLQLTGQGQVLWSTPALAANSWATMQTDGNLVVYTATNQAVWASHTSGHPGLYVQLTEDGNLKIAAGATVYWQTNSVNTTLTAGHWLYANQRLWSVGGQYEVVMQSDGNLAVYGPAGVPPWSSGTNGHPGAAVVMQTDGNLVVYTSTGTALWSTRTSRTTASAATIGPTGKLTLSTPDKITLFQAPAGGSGTAVVAAANTQRGVGYCYDGGNQSGPTKGNDPACTKTVGYDCSGLALYAIYQALHVTLPHYSGTQYSDAAKYGGTKVARTALLPGDLVFFIGDGGTAAAPGHVGIYVGNNQMLDAQGSGVPVAVHTLYSGYVGAVRYWH